MGWKKQPYVFFWEMRWEKCRKMVGIWLPYGFFYCSCWWRCFSDRCFGNWDEGESWNNSKLFWSELDLLWVKQTILVVDECFGLVISPPGLSVKHARSLCVDSIVVMIACKFPCVSMLRVDWSLIDFAKSQSHPIVESNFAWISRQSMCYSPYVSGHIEEYR